MSWRAQDVYRAPSDAPPPPLTHFIPANYSRAELLWLHEHLGQSVAVAIEDVAFPAGVNPHAVEPIIRETHRREEKRQIKGIEWAGFDVIRDSIQRYLAWMNKSEQVYTRTKRTANPIRHASQAVLDGRSLILGMVGADSKNCVVSEILPDGSRKSFNIELDDANGESLIREVNADPMGVLLNADKRPAAPVVDQITDDTEHGLLVCPICQYTINYDPKRQSTKAAAKARMGRHLSTAKLEVERHRILRSRLSHASAGRRR